MSLFASPFRRLVASLALAATGGLVLAGTAVAVPSAPVVTGVPSLTNAPKINPTWSASTPDGGQTIVRYEGGIVASAGDPTLDSTLTSGGDVPTPAADNAYVFRVRAVQSDNATSDYAVVPIAIDKTPPTVSGPIASSNPGEVAPWHRAPLTWTFATCTDNNPLAGACTVTWTTQGLFKAGAAAVDVRDAAGNVTTVPLPEFGYDTTPPARTDLTGPGNLIPGQPTFKWFPRAVSAAADLSGVDHYNVQYRLADNSSAPFTTLAVVKDQNLGLVEYTAQRDPALVPAPLPDNQLIDWRVVAVDKAGNENVGRIKQFTIDSTVPPAPEITGGPVGPTKVTTPTFTWQGTGGSFRWDVLEAGATAPLRSGNTQAKEITLGALADGAYTFRLTQFTPAGRESAEATRSFVVDTIPPAPPLILTRPTFPSVGDAIFTWSTEPGAYSRWSVTDSHGNVVVPPTDTPVTSATLPANLPQGTYSFSVIQIDAAGNESTATVEPFTVIAPLVQPTPAESIITILPKQNARLLKPKAGQTLYTRTPFLHWAPGPKGTKLFNIQIFRVTMKGTTANGTPRVTKILSAFPKQRGFLVPRSKTKPKSCYVWRVWPYTGREFTAKPLGVSNFCLASSKVIKRKSAIIAHRRALARKHRRG